MFSIEVKDIPQKTECSVYELQIFITVESRFIQAPIYDGNVVYITDSFLPPWRIKAHSFSQHSLAFRARLCAKNDYEAP